MPFSIISMQLQNTIWLSFDIIPGQTNLAPFSLLPPHPKKGLGTEPKKKSYHANS